MMSTFIELLQDFVVFIDLSVPKNLHLPCLGLCVFFYSNVSSA